MNSSHLTNCIRYGFDPTNRQRHAWVEKPILNHGVKYYPVRRYSWFPHSEIVEYFLDAQLAGEYCAAINKLPCEYRETKDSK